MRALRNNRLIITLGVILFIGFLTVSISSFRVSSQAVRETLIQNELPLTSNNIYSEIQASLLRPIYISSLMAHDTFLKDWLTGGEQDAAKVTRYLREIQKKYQVFSTFVVSALTKRYYHFDGVLKQVSPETAKDQWFFTMQNHHKDYRVDVDNNEAADDRLTIFINHKMTDDAGRFIGVTGLGLDVATTSHLIEDYKTLYDRDIYFVDRQGMIKSHADDDVVDRVNIREQPGIGAISQRILEGDQGSLSYTRDGETIYLRYRFIPELDWFLLVEQSEQIELAPLRRAFYNNLAMGGAITLLVLLISGYTVRHFQSRLERMATIDSLSGLFNRQTFEMLFRKAAAAAKRQGYDLSLLLFDIDLFKDINDRYGHLTGDNVIAQLSEAIKRGRRESDLVARWGGDEFVLLLPDCDEASARRIAEALRLNVPRAIQIPNHPVALTISIGVATYRRGESLEDLMARADTRLYSAKDAGRNQVC